MQRIQGPKEIIGWTIYGLLPGGQWQLLAVPECTADNDKVERRGALESGSASAPMLEGSEQEVKLSTKMHSGRWITLDRHNREVYFRGTQLSDDWQAARDTLFDQAKDLILSQDKELEELRKQIPNKRDDHLYRGDS